MLLLRRGEVPFNVLDATLNSHPLLFVAKKWHVVEEVTPNTSAMGRLSDAVWYDLSVATSRDGYIDKHYRPYPLFGPVYIPAQGLLRDGSYHIGVR